MKFNKIYNWPTIVFDFSLTWTKWKSKCFSMKRLFHTIYQSQFFFGEMDRSLSSHSMKHQYVPHYGNNSHYKIKQIFQLKLEHEWSSNIYLKWEIKVNIVANEVENICLEINRAALYIGTHLILYGSKIKILALSEELYCKYVGFQQTFCTPCYRYIVIIQGKMWSLYMVDFFFSPFIPCPSSALFPQKSDDKWAIFFFF